jgi:hypothetical protein
MTTDGIRTDDMTLAAVLRYHGYLCTVSADDKGNAWWQLPADRTDEFALGLVEDYNDNQVEIEPRKFMTEVRATRKAMYQVLGMGDKPRAESVPRRGRKG